MPIPDLTFTGSIPNAGGIALKDNLGNIIDQVGTDPGSAFFEGTPLSPLVGNIDQSYERKLGGSFGSCQDNDNNDADFQLITPSDPQNTLSPFTVCALACTTTTTTSTTTTSTTTTTTSTTTTACPVCLPYFNDWEAMDLTNWTTVIGTVVFSANDFGGGIARELQSLIGRNVARWCDCTNSARDTAVQAILSIPSTGPFGPSPAKNAALLYNYNPITNTTYTAFITIAPGAPGIGIQFFNGVTAVTLAFTPIAGLLVDTFYILRVEIDDVDDLGPGTSIVMRVFLFDTAMNPLGSTTPLLLPDFANGDCQCFGIGSSFSYAAFTDFLVESIHPLCVVVTTTTTTTVTPTTTTIAPPMIFFFGGMPDGVALWDNYVVSPGDSRVYDDFDVPAPGRTVTDVFGHHIATPGVPVAVVGLLEIRTGVSAGVGGLVIFSGFVPIAIIPTGGFFFGFPEFIVVASGLVIPLAPGTYHVCLAPDLTPSPGFTSSLLTTSGAGSIGSPILNNNAFHDSITFLFTFTPSTIVVGYPADWAYGVTGFG